MGFVVDGDSLILPVNYAYVDTHVVFCTSVETALARVGVGNLAAFEIDGADALYHEGLDVLVRGRLEPVTDPDELERVSTSPVRPWVARARRQWLRMCPSAVSGRRIRPG